ncbi:hypothetical protein ACFL20_11800 [Spirochaetota bacterium]
MKDDRDIEKIANQFLGEVLNEDIEQLNAHEKSPRSNQKNLGDINFGNLARDMASSIQEQMGITNENIKRTAKELVVKLARKHKPEITETELHALVREMVPDEREVQNRIPFEVMIEMIDFFVCYSRGKLSQSELRGLPGNWITRYWASFPMNIKKLIAAYLKGSMSRKEFWVNVRKILT